MPQRKVGAGALAGSLSALVVWIAGANGIVIPAEAAVALSTVLTFIVSYFVPAE